MIRRLAYLVSLAIAVVGGAAAGSALVTTNNAETIGVRDASGALRAYLVRDGRLLLLGSNGYHYAEIDPVIAGRLVNTLAALPIADAGDDFTIELDGVERLAVNDPRTGFAEDAHLRAFVDALWREVNLRTGVPAATPSLRVRLTPLTSDPERSIVLPTGIVRLEDALASGDRFSGARLADLVAWRVPLAIGVDYPSFAVRLDGTFYEFSWSADPGPGDPAPAPGDTPPAP